MYSGVYAEELSKYLSNHSGKDVSLNVISAMECKDDRDCKAGESCRTKKGAGTECRTKVDSDIQPTSDATYTGKQQFFDGNSPALIHIPKDSSNVTTPHIKI